MEKKFKVVSIHFTNECNLNCPFCYKKKGDKRKEKGVKFWYKLVPYIKPLTEQIALGGGEPFTNIEFIKKFGKICHRNGIILNVTSNGRLLMPLDDKVLKDVLKDITMVSLSYDNYKVKNVKELLDYVHLVKRIKKLTKTQVGCNLLVNKEMFKDNGLSFIKIVNMIFNMGVNRVFALCPKIIESPEILKFKKSYEYLTAKYEMFFIDDLTKMVLENDLYSNWKVPCHYGKDIISISEDGSITGCSFDSGDKAVLKLEKPKDILKINDIKFEDRFSCPYIKINEVDKILNSNCSESVYRLSKYKIAEFDEKELEIFKDIINRLQKGEFGLDFPAGYIEGEDFDYTPYFEKTILDLFLDYFGVEAKRNHWTGDATTYMEEEKYNKLMEEFCKTYNLEYKNIYERRYKER